MEYVEREIFRHQFLKSIEINQIYDGIYVTDLSDIYFVTPSWIRDRVL